MVARAAFLLTAMLGLGDCGGDETVAGYGGGDVTWALAELDGTAFEARATLGFPEEGRIEGEAPCNRYSGDQTAPYPWFRAEKIAATRRACPELDAEQAFLTALESMTLSEVAGDTLILSNDAGRQMVFRVAR